MKQLWNKYDKFGAKVKIGEEARVGPPRSPYRLACLAWNLHLNWIHSRRAASALHIAFAFQKYKKKHLWQIIEAHNYISELKLNAHCITLSAKNSRTAHCFCAVRCLACICVFVYLCVCVVVCLWICVFVDLCLHYFPWFCLALVFNLSVFLALNCFQCSGL